MNRIAKLSAALIISAAAAAPVLAAPETYTIDGSHTFPSFSYSHLGLSTQISKFDKTTGTVTLDKEAKTGAVDITIDMKSVNTGYGTFDEHIQDTDFLDTASHPTATFKSTKVRFDGDKPVAIDGELTIKGVTKPVTLQVTHFVNKPHPMMKKDTIGANATTVIKRSEFNAGKYAPNVGDDVTITVAIEAIKN
ncbi:YceI family protein [Thauera linaloolentis]|uniref:YceI family protein n=1 Tax=Thauera linaloolentis (strain DSM 12138 / JCM 21573 / CCUG 41526 / CIP 105981 / IAM 15112 / NBRC 102519 / 47Lol) TaxID=1123367 RepID=N6YUI5_THAL4|nr:YceI family protein [Thauera linaloolentis]ENO86072.1 YceI family protein [Thauera linaloolentis 47Lol = DSM 12138]MCM8565221.1 YceI family protein [Thauera linaloolentis]